MLPDKRTWYLLGSSPIGFEDFFDVDDMKKLLPVMFAREFSAGGKSKAVMDFSPLDGVMAFPDKAGRALYECSITACIHTDIPLHDLWYSGTEGVEPATAQARVGARS